MLKDGKPSAALMRAAERWGLAHIRHRVSKTARLWRHLTAIADKCPLCSKRIARGRRGNHLADHLKGKP